MCKFYFFIFCFSLLFISKSSYGQIPTFTYNTPQKLIVGIKVTPLSPKQTGGAVPAQIYSKVITLAGNGYYGDKDTLARYSSFENPISVAMDSKGNLYVADANLNMIRKISAKGVVSVFAGNKTKGAKNGQDTAARFNYPTGIAVDAQDNVYVADFSNNMIRKITPGGFVSTFAGNINGGNKDGQGAIARFNLPYGLTVDPYGNVIVADTYNNKIRRISPTGNVTTMAGNGAQGRKDGYGSAVTFNTPYNVASDSFGFIYVADQGNNCIRKVDIIGVTSTFSDTTFKTPVGIAVDKLNRVYLSTRDAFTITQFDTNGKPIGKTPFSGGYYKAYVDSTDTLSSYKGNMGLTFDGKNSLLIADAGNDVIRKLAINGYTVHPRLPGGLIIDTTGSITGTPTTVSPAADYTVTGYNSSGSFSSKINIQVGIAAQVITFKPLVPVTYGSADFDPLATSNDTIIPVLYKSSNLAVATIVKNKIHIIGAGSTIITASQAGNTNYTAASAVNQTLIVNKAVLTITADDKIKTILKDNPPLTISYKGFVYSDDNTVLMIKPLAVTTAIASSAAGTYPITVSGAVAANYSFNYVAGKLIVFPVPTITAAGSTTIVSGNSVTLTAAPSTGYAYQWYLDGNSISGATSNTYQAAKTGAYSVAITANAYTTYSLYTQVLEELQLPTNNFNISVTSVTCKGSNNGIIHISAGRQLKYTAVVSGNNLNNAYPFTDTLSIGGLSPGSYNVCFSVDGQIYSQCYQLNVTEPKDLSVYTTVNEQVKLLSLQLDGGNTFTIDLNNVVYTTNQKELSLPLAAGYNKLSVTTDNLCQGVIEKVILVARDIIPFPNPFQDVLNVNIGNQIVSKVNVNIINTANGSSVYKYQATNQSGVMQFDVSKLQNGIYYLNLNLDNNKSGYKIIKK